MFIIFFFFLLQLKACEFLYILFVIQNVCVRSMKKKKPIKIKTRNNSQIVICLVNICICIYIFIHRSISGMSTVLSIRQMLKISINSYRC